MGKLLKLLISATVITVALLQVDVHAQAWQPTHQVEIAAGSGLGYCQDRNSRSLLAEINAAK